MYQSWIKRIAQAVADQIEGKHGEHDGKPGIENKMGSGENLITFRAKHGAPFRRGRLCPETQKGECGRIQNSGGDAESPLYD